MLVVRSPAVEDVFVTHVEVDFLTERFFLGHLAVHKTHEVKYSWSCTSILLYYFRAVVSLTF